MALLLKKTVVYHPGRTGGHWVKAVVRQAGLIRGESPQIHATPEDLRNWSEAVSRPWSIAFVRHPATWIRSFWIHETHFGWTNDVLCPADEFSTFSEYLEYLVDTFPKGAVRQHFAPFVDNVRLIGKFESLATDLSRLLVEAGEVAAATPIVIPPINRSADDIVSASAKAPLFLWERFLGNESEYCRRFGYDHIPERCIADDHDQQRRWFPVLSSKGDATAEESEVEPDNTFLFSDGTRWKGRPECRRWQLGIYDALCRNRSAESGGFLELDCSDGFFVFLAESLGYRPCYGIFVYPRATTKAAAARLGSHAEFVQASMLAPIGCEPVGTVLIKGLLNNTPWPHLLLLYAKEMLAPGGELVIGCVIVETDPDPGLSLSNFGSKALLPQSCPTIMSRTYLRNVISQCGLAVDEICSEYDEIGTGQMLRDDICQVLQRPSEGLLRRVVWRLRVADARTDSPELAWWMRSEPAHLRDCRSIDLNKDLRRVIDELTTENMRLKFANESLAGALNDRESDLRMERQDAVLRNAELVDRTLRLERALADLDAAAPTRCQVRICPFRSA